MTDGAEVENSLRDSLKATETASAAITKPIWRWKITGYSSLRKRKSVRRFVLRLE